MSILRQFEEENRPNATPQIPALPVVPPVDNPMQLADAGNPADEPIIPPVELQDTLQAPLPQTGQAAPQQSNMPGMLQPDNLDRSPRIPFEEITVDVNVPDWNRIRIPTAPMPSSKPNNVDAFLDSLGDPSQSQILQPFNQQQPAAFDRNPFLEFLTSIFGGKQVYDQYYKQGVGQLGGLSGIAYGLGLPLNVVSGVAADLGRLGAAVEAGRQALIDPNWLSQATRESTNLADFARRAAQRYSGAYIQQLGATIPAGPGTYTQQALLGRQFSFADERTNERGDFNPLGLLPDFGTYKRGVDLPETELSQAYRNNGQVIDAITSIIGVPTQSFIQAMSGNKQFKIPKFSDWLADRFKTMENDPGNYYRTLAGFGLDAIVDGGIADLPRYVSRGIEKSTSKAVTKAATPRSPSSSIVLSQPSIGFAEPRPGAAQQSGPNWTRVRSERMPDGSVWNRAEPYQQAPRPPEVDIIDADFDVVSRTDGQTDTPLIPPYLSNAPRISSDARLPDGSPWVKDMAELRLPDGTLWQRIETLDVRPRQVRIPVPELPVARVNGMVLDAELLKTYLRSPTGLIEINDLQLPGSRQFDMLPGQEPMPMLSGQPAPSALTGASPSQGQLLPGIEMFPPIETMPPTSPMAPPQIDVPAPATAPRSLVDEPPIEALPSTDPAVSPIAPPAAPTPPTAPRSMIEEPPIELAPSPAVRPTTAQAPAPPQIADRPVRGAVSAAAQLSRDELISRNLGLRPVPERTARAGTYTTPDGRTLYRYRVPTPEELAELKELDPEALEVYKRQAEKFGVKYRSERELIARMDVMRNLEGGPGEAVLDRRLGRQRNTRRAAEQVNAMPDNYFEGQFLEENVTEGLKPPTIALKNLGVPYTGDPLADTETLLAIASYIATGNTIPSAIRKRNKGDFVTTTRSRATLKEALLEFGSEENIIKRAKELGLQGSSIEDLATRLTTFSSIFFTRFKDLKERARLVNKVRIIPESELVSANDIYNRLIKRYAEGDSSVEVEIPRSAMRQGIRTPLPDREVPDKLIDSIVSTLYRKPSQYSEGLLQELGDQLSTVSTQGVLRLRAVENYLGSIFRQLPQLPEQIKRDILDMTPAGVVDFLTTTSLLPKGLGEKVLDDVAEMVKLELPTISELVGRLKNPDVVNDDAAFREVVNSLPVTLRGEPTDQVYRKLLQNLQNTQTSAELSVSRLATLQEYFDEFSEQFDATVTPETLIDDTVTDVYLGTRLSNDASLIGAKVAVQPERAAAAAVSPVADSALAGTPRLVQLKFTSPPRIMPVQLTESLNRTLAEVLDDAIRIPYLTKLGEFYDITADGRILNTAKLTAVGETAIDDVASPLSMRTAELNSRLDPEAPYNVQAQMLDEMEEILSDSYNEVDNVLDDMYSAYDELEDYMFRSETSDVPDAGMFYEQSIRELLEVDDDLVKAFDPPIKARTSKQRFMEFAESVREALLYDDPDTIINAFIHFRDKHYSMRKSAEDLYNAATEAYTRAKQDLGIEVPFDLFPAIDEIC